MSRSMLYDKVRDFDSVRCCMHNEEVRDSEPMSCSVLNEEVRDSVL